MNVPKPCNRCENLYYDSMYEDDPDYLAECQYGQELGNQKCKFFARWRSKKELELESIKITDHSKCSYSTGICGSLTAGQGYLDDNGYWEYPCHECVKKLKL